MRSPELLAPAGDFDCLRAAVENGADAVYFGLTDGFNARARATNFLLSDVPHALDILHRRGLKGYVTLNTLAFSDELPRLQDVVRALSRMGVDAVIVQDLGLVRLIRAVAPDLPIHASTQMTLTSGECIEVAADLGIDRIILARELSLDEIRQIRQQTILPLEVFVHGALCVAYSGQCLTSEAWGGRSANRGQCAQACRLPYELVCNGRTLELGAVKYLLSPQDLAAYELTPELIAAGVEAFKIEGRLKSAEYVANITQHYRRALDAATAGRPVNFTEEDVREMELSFSRGFSPGWLQGNDHKRLVPGVSSAKRGVYLGDVVRIDRRRVVVRLATPVRRGDGVVFAGDRALGVEQGGRIFRVFSQGRLVEDAIARGVVELEFQPGTVDLRRLVPGQAIWKTDDPVLSARWRRTFTSGEPLRRVDVDLSIRAVAGAPLHLTMRSVLGHQAEWQSSEPLAVADKHPATPEFFRQQLGRLGQTVYQLRECVAEIVGGPLVPFSLLGEARKFLIAELDRQAASVPARQIIEADLVAQWRTALRSASPGITSQSSELWVLCRSWEQFQAVVSLPVAGLYVDFQDFHGHREAVEVARELGKPVWLATPRIQKPGEMGLFRALQRSSPSGILVRNLAGLRFCRAQQLPYVTDFSLNAANELTVQYLREQEAQRITASYDLNREQLLRLVEIVPAEWLEIVVHQHMPMFHMEHCVFCAVLSPGTNKTNCGRPCDRHEVHLRDRVGMEHRLTADVGCRNTLFNAVPQSAAEIVGTLQTQGVRHFRVELLAESAAEAVTTIELYLELLAGRISGAKVWRTLRAANRVGVTRGTLEERRNPLAIL